MKKLLLVTGVVWLAVVWGVILPLSDRQSFSVHMVVHMSVVAGIAPLVAAYISGSRYDLTMRLPWFTPVFASILEMVVVWGWHLPVSRRLAEVHVIVTILEQMSFIGVGLLLWLTCLGGALDGHAGRRLAGVFGLLFTSMHMTLLGALLALSPRSLYGDGQVTCFGVSISPIVDQQVGGVIMLLVGAVAYLLGGIVLLASVLEPRQVSGERL